MVSKLDDLLRNSTDHHREFIERFDNIDMRMQLLEDRIQRQDETLNKLFGVIELLGQEDTGTYFVLTIQVMQKIEMTLRILAGEYLSSMTFIVKTEAELPGSGIVCQ